jgi:hypothetical protein
MDGSDNYSLRRSDLSSSGDISGDGTQVPYSLRAVLLSEIPEV